MPDVLQLEKVKQVTSDKSEPKPKLDESRGAIGRVPAEREGAREIEGWRYLALGS